MNDSTESFQEFIIDFEQLLNKYNLPLYLSKQKSLGLIKEAYKRIYNRQCYEANLEKSKIYQKQYRNFLNQKINQKELKKVREEFYKVNLNDYFIDYRGKWRRIEKEYNKDSKKEYNRHYYRTHKEAINAQKEQRRKSQKRQREKKKEMRRKVDEALGINYP